MALTDSSTRVRSGEELDASRIDPYLKAHIPGLVGQPAISQFPGGASNLTYLIEYPGQELVLRRPPFGQKAKSAHDMGREFRILNQLKDAFPYCPKAYAHCTDETLIGSEFYVMERVKGIILRSDIPAELGLSAEASQTLCKSFVERLVELHRVDYNACGLGDLGNTLAYWIEAGDPAPVQLMRRQPSNASGMLTRREFVDYYAERSGIQIDNYDFYYTYGLFRLAGIVQQIYYRYYHGQTQDKRFAQFVQMNALLEQMSLNVIRRSSL